MYDHLFKVNVIVFYIILTKKNTIFPALNCILEVVMATLLENVLVLAGSRIGFTYLVDSWPIAGAFHIGKWHTFYSTLWLLISYVTSITDKVSINVTISLVSCGWFYKVAMVLQQIGWKVTVADVEYYVLAD